MPTKRYNQYAIGPIADSEELFLNTTRKRQNFPLGGLKLSALIPSSTFHLAPLNRSFASAVL